jgi:hypothetical protein
VIAHLLQLAARNLRFLLGVPILVGLIVLGLGVMKPRDFEGIVVVAPVTNRSPISAVGLAATVFSANALGGFQSSPNLVSRLVRLDGVLLKVATDSTATGERVIDRLLDDPSGGADDRESLNAMRNAVSSTADLQSGLVTIRVTARDTATVRHIATRLLSATSDAFVEATRAQASALKHSQDARVESSLQRLRRAEENLRAFNAANRVTSQHSPAALSLRRIERELRVAEELYTQAVTDREAAAAKELEETPALVVVDPLPDRIRTKSRGLLLRVILWSALTFLTVVATLMVRDQVAVARRTS